MAELFQPVVPKPTALTEAEFHSALCAGLARVASNIGRGNLADKARPVIARYAGIIAEADKLRGE